MKVRVNLNNNTMKPTYNKSRIMKMAHVRRSVDKMMFGCVKGDFAYYLRGAWATVKDEQAKVCEEPKATCAPANSPAFVAGCLDYYANAPMGTYFGD